MDVYLQFQLYYADDIQKMQLWSRERETTTKKSKKRGKSKTKPGNSGEDLVGEDSEKSGKDESTGEKTGDEKTETDENGGGKEGDGKKGSDVDEEDDDDDDGDENDEEGDGEEDDGEEKLARKVPRRRDFYTICKDNGLGSLVKKFGLIPEQFAENLRDNYQRHEPEQVPEEPDELAEQFICKCVVLFCSFPLF